MSLPGHGETIGEAYIRILADGSGLDKDIRKEWKRHEPEFRAAGDDSSRAYREGFDENWKKRPMWAESVKSLRRGRGEFEAVGTYLGDGTAKTLRKTMEKELGDKQLARRIFKNLSEEAQRTGDLGVFKKGLGKNLASEIARATRQIQEANARTVQDEKKTQEARKRLAASTEKEFERMMIRRSQILERQGIKDIHGDRDRLRARIEESIRDIRKGDNTQSALLRRSLSNFNDHAERGLVKVTGFFNRSLREMTPLEQKANKLNKEFDHFARTVGKAAGAGSRNNFFNALGKSVEGVTRLFVGGIPRIVGTMGELRSEFGLAGRRVDEFGNKVSFTRRVMNVMDTALQNTEQLLGFLSRGIIGAVGGFGAMFTIAAPLASALSSIAAVVVALSGAIAFGLVGAIGAALPILGALGAAVATVALVFSGLTTAQKKALKLELKPVINDLTQLRKVAGKALFSDLKTQIPLLGRVVKNLTPIFQRVGRSLALSFTGFLKMLNGPDFKKNLDSMRKFFPDAVTKLGTIFTHVFSGFSSVLRALVPYAEKLLNSLVNSTKRFAEFANSGKGQNRIKDFMDRAWQSGTKLWRLVKDLSKVLGDLLSAGRAPGNGLLDSMNASLERFDRFLRSDKGRIALAGWFSDMKSFLHALGVLVGGIGKLFNALDSPEGHQILNGLLQVLGHIASTVADLIPPFLKLAHTVLPSVFATLKVIFSPFKALLELLANHQTTAKIVAVSIVALYTSLKLLQTVTVGRLFLAPLTSGIATAARAFSRTTLGTQLGVWALNLQQSASGAIGRINGTALRVGKAVAGLGIALAGISAGSTTPGIKGAAIGIGGGAIGGALIGSAIAPGIGTAIGAVVGGVGGAIAHFWGKANQEAQNAKKIHLQVIEQIRNAADELRSSLEQDNNAIGAMTKGMIAAQLQRPTKPGGKSALDIAQSFNLNVATVVSAAGGDQGSKRLLQSQLDGVRNRIMDAFHAWQQKNKKTIVSHGQSITVLPSLEDYKKKTSAGQQLKDLDDLTKQLGIEGQAVRNSIRLADQQARATGTLNLATRDASSQVVAYGTKLKGASLAAQLNRRWVHDHTVALGTQAAALLKSGKSATTAAQSWLKGRDSLLKQATAAGFNGTIISRLISKYGQIPKNVLTKLAADPTKANQGILVALAKLHLLPQDVITKLLADPKDLSRNTILAIAHLGLIPKSTLTKLLGNHSPLDSSTKAALRALGKLPYSKVVTLNAKGNLEAKITAITGQLNNIRGSTLNLYSTKGSAGATIHFGAAGGILNKATFVRPGVIGGEAGLEALVPLRRPLSQVDPSVRALSAFAQGMTNGNAHKMGSGGVVSSGPQKLVQISEGAIQVITPTTDPEAVAMEVLNHAIKLGGYN